MLQGVVQQSSMGTARARLRTDYCGPSLLMLQIAFFVGACREAIYGADRSTQR